MNIRRNRGVAVATGIGAVVSSAGATMLGFSAPAIAATAPVCDASQSNATVNATLKATNAAALKTYLKSKPYVALHTGTVKAKAAIGKAKGSKAKAAATKKWAAAAKKEAAALAAFKKANTYTAYSGSNTPAPITSTSADHPGLYDWGSYTTRVIIKGGKLSNVCTFVDQTNDADVSKNPPVPVSDIDKATSRDTYQGITHPWNDPSFPGNLPVLWFATTYAPAKSAATIEANVHQCVTQLIPDITAPCIKGGLGNSDLGGLTGATYTVQGYEGSLHAALLAAKAAKSIG